MKQNQSDCDKCSNKGKIHIGNGYGNVPCDVVYKRDCVWMSDNDIKPCKSFEHAQTMPESKPPSGVRPWFIVADERLSELGEGMKRYLDAYKPLPIEWVSEYNELITYMESRKKEQQ